MRVGTGLGIAGVVVVGAAVVQWVRPIAPAQVQMAVVQGGKVPGTLSMPWPNGVQAVVDLPGVGWVGGLTHGPSAPEPIGSVAKMMTALLVIQHHPLSLYGSGPSITITPNEVKLYQSDAASYQSVMAVTAGEKLSERTLLEGLLIPSGNNIATLLGDWIAGSGPAFAREMNAEAKRFGLTHTHYAGPSGLRPETVSTAVDQVKVAETLMKSPVLAAISAMPQMTLPNGGITYNYNSFLGRDGIFGVKTGSTVVGGAAYIWAANKTIAGRTQTVYGGVLGQLATSANPQLKEAVLDGQALINATAKAVHPYAIYAAGHIVGRLTTAWGSDVPLILKSSVNIEGWAGLRYQESFTKKFSEAKANQIPAGTQVGILTITAGSQKISRGVFTKTAVAGPSAAWRISR